MSLSETEICNLALMKNAAKRINSIEERSENARYCKQFWPHVRDGVLRSHPWKCATARKSLSPLATTPDFEYDYQYQQPTNPYCLRVLDLYDVNTAWKVEGRLILCSDDTIDCFYIKRVTDTSEYDPLLTEVLILKMAIKISVPITGGDKLIKGLITELEELSFPEARSIDSMEQSRQEFKTETWSDARK